MSTFRYNSYFEHKRSKWPAVVGVLAVLAGLLAVLAYAYFGWYLSSLKPVAQNQSTTSFTVEQGASVRDVAQTLAADGLIRSSRAFELYMRLHSQTGGLKAGTYSLSTGNSVEKIVSVLAEGKITEKQITIGPGLRLDKIKKRFTDAGFTAAEVDKAFNKDLYRDKAVMKYVPANLDLEGMIFPDTYNFNENTTVQDVVGRAIDELDAIMTSDLIAEYKKADLTPYEALTLASIIEKEVSTVNDRQVVAQIFLTRLSEGTILGSDATYVYGAYKMGAEAVPELDSPYNTRKYAGLPPGPINNVSRSALEALAFPATTDYQFFVTGDDGVNYFGRTEAEHEALIAAHCKIACAAGYQLPTD